MKTDPIHKFILKDKDNLRIGATVGEAWPEVRQTIVSEFLGRLKGRINRRLTGWKFGGYDGNFFITENAGYYFWKPSWETQYSLALQMCNYGEKAMLGVSRDKDYISKRPYSEELFDAVSTIYPAVEKNSWWEARVKLQSPSSDWRNSDVLWQMHKDNDFLEVVAGQLLELEKISSPIIDRLVRKYKK